MNLRKILYSILFISSAVGLASCANDNPPFGELAGTRWNGTNIGSGVLVDIQFGPVGTYDVSMTFYQDPIPYTERGQKIDTTGNRQFGMNGFYVPLEYETDKGEFIYDYEWEVYLIKDDGSEHIGDIYYDNKIMFLRMDSYAWPMTKIY